MISLNIARDTINKHKKNYINYLTKKKVKIDKSSLVSLRYLIFSDFELKKKEDIIKNITKINLKCQIKNLFFIRHYIGVDFYGNTSQENLKRYKKMVLSWSYKNNFDKDGSYKDNYFKSVKNNNDILWVTILGDAQLPKKINKNILIIHPKKGGLLGGVSNIFNYIKQLLAREKLSFINFFHQLSYDSYLANEIESFFKKNDLLAYIKRLYLPLETQPFQNSIINLAKKENIETIGFDQTGNPFPFYNSFSPISPDKLVVHSYSSFKFYTQKLNWPKKRIKKIPSTRMLKRNKNFFKNKIFLPILLHNNNLILERLNYIFSEYSTKFCFKKFKVNLHPATKNISKFQKILDDINKLKKKYENSRIKNKGNLSLHVGNTSTIIEALESGSEVIHVCSSILFDPLSTDYWNSVESKKINHGIFNYKLKRYGHCVTFKKKGKSLIL